MGRRMVQVCRRFCNHRVCSGVIVLPWLHQQRRDAALQRALGIDLPRPSLQVDNNPFSFLANPCNGLPVAPFTGDPSDDHLLASVRPRFCLRPGIVASDMHDVFANGMDMQTSR